MISWKDVKKRRKAEGPGQRAGMGLKEEPWCVSGWLWKRRRMKAAGEVEQVGKRGCYPAVVGTCLTQLPSRGGILEGSSFSWIFATHLCPGLATGRSWHSLGWGHCTQDEPPRHFLRSAPENSASCPKSTGSCTKPML